MHNHADKLRTKQVIKTLNPYTTKPYSTYFSKLYRKRIQLPVWNYREQFLDLLNKQQIFVLTGETGSGKSTQIPQWCMEFLHQKSKFQNDGHTKMVACTQPRRIAAVKLATRVAIEADIELGKEIGYCIRFENVCSAATVLKYCTEGMILREMQNDLLLKKYDIILLDEVHERTINVDLLMSLLKETMKFRPEFKVVVMSATLDAERLKVYFGKCPLLSIPGRTNPVEIFYAKEPVVDFVEKTASTVLQIHLCHDLEGDILVFLPGQWHISKLIELIQKKIDIVKDETFGSIYNREFGELILIPLYSSLNQIEQDKVFKFEHARTSYGQIKRKCIVSTNYAETSLTIDGVVFVIDSGFAKQKVYNSRTHIESLLVCPISQASAMQRAGRAGRTKPGKCFRLYTEKAFKEEMQKQTQPEILRSDIANLILRLKKMNFDDLVHFDYLDPPAPESLMQALKLLNLLSAIDNDGELTLLGSMMAEFPLDPRLSKILISSTEMNCAQDILSIVSLLSMERMFERPMNLKEQADAEKKKFLHTGGDHLTLLNVYLGFKKAINRKNWCYKNFLNYDALKKADRLRSQLVIIMDKLGLKCDDANLKMPDKYQNIRRCLITGFFMQIAHLEEDGTYLDIQNNFSVKFSSCSIFAPPKIKKNKELNGNQVPLPEWVLYNELILSNDKFIRIVISIEAEWLLDIAPQYFYTYELQNSKAKCKLVEAGNVLNSRADEIENVKDGEIYNNDHIIQNNEKVDSGYWTLMQLMGNSQTKCILNNSNCFFIFQPRESWSQKLQNLTSIKFEQMDKIFKRRKQWKSGLGLGSDLNGKLEIFQTSEKEHFNESPEITDEEKNVIRTAKICAHENKTQSWNRTRKNLFNMMGFSHVDCDFVPEETPDTELYAINIEYGSNIIGFYNELCPRLRQWGIIQSQIYPQSQNNYLILPEKSFSLSKKEDPKQIFKNLSNSFKHLKISLEVLDPCETNDRLRNMLQNSIESLNLIIYYHKRIKDLCPRADKWFEKAEPHLNDAKTLFQQYVIESKIYNLL